MHNHPRTARLYGLGESELRHVRSRWVSRFKWGKNTKGRTTLLCVRTSPQYDNEAVIPVKLRPGIWGWLPHWLSDVRILQKNVIFIGLHHIMMAPGHCDIQKLRSYYTEGLTFFPSSEASNLNSYYTWRHTICGIYGISSVASKFFYLMT